MFEDRARRVCSRCPVRRPCLREAIEAENPQKIILRNTARGRGPERVRERVLPVGIYAGTNPDQRWAPDVIHRDDCAKSACEGCRPLAERLDILEQRFRDESPRWLTASESVC